MTKKEISFEQALSRLEKIVTKLEQGEISLEESLADFEEGIKLSRFCNQKLEEAKKKVEILIKKDGKLVPQPFPPENLPPANSPENNLAEKSDGSQEELF